VEGDKVCLFELPRLVISVKSTIFSVDSEKPRSTSYLVSTPLFS